MTLNRTRIIATSTLVTLLLGSTACESNKKDSSAPSTCEKLLGPAGIEWIKGSRAREAEPAETASLRDAKESFYEDAKRWDPDSDETPTFLGAEVCRVATPSEKSRKGYLSLKYGASILSFDYPFNKEKDIYDSVSVLPVNSDVKLVTRGDEETFEYSIYVRCKVDGAPSSQKQGVPIEGTMRDTLTGDTDTKTHLQYLLHSARTVVKAFSCQNKPVVPTRLPSA